ncbi:MAG TPA: tRNA pseudouridine(13) synthase TruD [Candidatus Altiarchaeales archaeon]|nr:tRNA pseudouridine(13) synthase TruD [Candidatus Altiarchaeales archaeon]
MDPPDLEKSVGIEVYGTSTEGVGGFLKQVPEDFIVEEMTSSGNVCLVEGKTDFESSSGAYTHFTLVKRNWSVFRAVGELSSRLHVSRKRFGFAGTKDKFAVTAQRMSVHDVSREALEKVGLKDLVLKDFSESHAPIHLGNLSGNRFLVTVRGIELPLDECGGRIADIAGGLSAGYPNFYGVQRFGVQRPVNHVIGKKILKGDLEGAVLTYLGGFSDNEYESGGAKEFRRIAWSGDFKEALKVAPAYLGPEKSMLNHLVENPGDYLGALKRLPESLQVMFVHAFQSYVFNRALSECIRNGYTVERLPVVGFKSNVDDVSRRILEGEGVDAVDFDVRGERSWSSGGDVRECFEFAKDLKFDVGEDELNDGFRKAVFHFELGAGSYATVFLREFLKNRYYENIRVNQ